jgi:3D (Asp-Asp-Asp) domain-containing protein
MRRKFIKLFSIAVLILGSFAMVIGIGERFDIALAADGPTSTTASHSEPLEIPGSFKELGNAKDTNTAKLIAENNRVLAPTMGDPHQLGIDSEKVRGTLPPAETFPDDEVMDFHATAYCLKGRTASGAIAQTGLIAADPKVLPLGTVVHIRAGSYTGTYTVADTGGKIKGRRVDVYVPTHREAMLFGRRQVKIKVVRRGGVKKERPRGTLEASLN